MNSSDFTWHYGQPWLPQTESHFAPGEVHFGLMDNSLVVHAKLTDVCPIQDVFSFNTPAFTQCDVFEIFIGPADEKAYYEFHVTPSNSILQLFIDGTGSEKTIEERMVSKPLFTSETSITPVGWDVKARVPLDGLFSQSHPEWLLSFGRYDYTPGAARPAISTTSPHQACNFHRKHEWRKVKLADLPKYTA